MIPPDDTNSTKHCPTCTCHTRRSAPQIISLEEYQRRAINRIHAAVDNVIDFEQRRREHEYRRKMEQERLATEVRAIIRSIASVGLKYENHYTTMLVVVGELPHAPDDVRPTRRERREPRPINSSHPTSISWKQCQAAHT